MDTNALRELADELFHTNGTHTTAAWRALLNAADEIERLREAVDAAQLRSIEASNPGIDMDEVKRIRAERADR